jgi:hypothetical protein
VSANDWRKGGSTLLMVRLAQAIESSLYLLSDLRNFNGEQWTIRYPHLRNEVGEPSRTLPKPFRPTIR